MVISHARVRVSDTQITQHAESAIIKVALEPLALGLLLRNGASLSFPISLGVDCGPGGRRVRSVICGGRDDW